MRNQFGIVVGRIVLALFFGLSGIVYAVPITWNLLGNYVLTSGVQGGTAITPLSITSQDFSTGKFNGTAYGNPIWNATFDGSRIYFEGVSRGTNQFGEFIECLYIFDGVISPAGLFGSGAGMGQNCAGHGFFGGDFGTISGHATQLLPAFQIFENVGPGNCPNLPSGSTGCFVFINNTTNYAVNGFYVGNDDAISASTTRSNWSAFITNINFGNGPEKAFAYLDSGGAGFNPILHGSDSSFFYTTDSLGSPIMILADGPNGPVSFICTTDTVCDPFGSSVPEPTSGLLLGLGLLGLCWSRRTLLKRMPRPLHEIVNGLHWSRKGGRIIMERAMTPVRKVGV